MSTPYMNLNLPTPSTTLGPTWASMLNTALSAVDSHDHTNGKGLPVTPAGMLINAALDFAGYAASDVGSVQLSTLANYLLTPSNIHSVNGDLVWTNSSGVAVPITSGSAVVGAPGNIQNLGPPAGAAYDALTSTFQWFSGSGVMAGLDAGSLILRESNNALGNAVQIQAPPTPTTWTLTLPNSPGGPPGGILAILPTGVSQYWYPDSGGTLEESGTVIRVKIGGIKGELTPPLVGTPVGQIALQTIGTANIGLGQITGGITGLSTPSGLIAYRTIVTENLAQSAITTAKIAVGNVTGGGTYGPAPGYVFTPTGSIAARTIDGGNIGFDAIYTENYYPQSVDTDAIKDLAVTEAKIGNGAVTNAKLGTNNIDAAKLLDSTLTAAKTVPAFGFGFNSFTANGAYLNGTLASPWGLASTGNVTLYAGKPFRVFFQPQDFGGDADFDAYNEDSVARYVWIKIVIYRNSGTTAMRSYTQKFRCREALLANYVWAPIIVAPICDTVSTTDTDYSAVATIWTSTVNKIRLNLNNWTLILQSL